VVEIAVRNQQVADYCKHWEERALKAESERSSAIKEARELPSHEDIKNVLGNGWKGFKLNDEDDLDFVIGQIRLAIMKCYAIRGER